LNTLGVAEYRVEDYARAVATLSRCDAENTNSRRGAQPADLAFLGMTLKKLGRDVEAAATLTRLGELMKLPTNAANSEAQRFLVEADNIISGVHSTATPKGR
jgi:hypothetical protein